jgi:acyl-coenzyme A synthetase/AMP-(fatty) acid ligase
VVGGEQELHDAVYVVGALDEVITLRGMHYHPIDIENSVLRCHKKIAECAVFTWTNLLVVVVELDGNESEALDLVPLVTNTVLEEHQLIVGVVVVVDPGELHGHQICSVQDLTFLSQKLYESYS